VVAGTPDSVRMVGTRRVVFRALGPLQANSMEKALPVDVVRRFHRIVSSGVKTDFITGYKPVSLFRELSFSRQVLYRPAHSPLKLSKNKGILVGPVGFEPTRGLLLRQLRMPVPPRA
jgi:hypothetical protein